MLASDGSDMALVLDNRCLRSTSSESLQVVRLGRFGHDVVLERAVRATAQTYQMPGKHRSRMDDVRKHATLVNKPLSVRVRMLKSV